MSRLMRKPALFLNVLHLKCVKRLALKKQAKRVDFFTTLANRGGRFLYDNKFSNF